MEDQLENYIDDIGIMLVLLVISVVGLTKIVPILGASNPKLILGAFAFALLLPSIVLLTVYGQIEDANAFALFSTLVGFVGGLFTNVSKSKDEK